MGEALAIDRKALLRLAEEAEVSVKVAGGIIDDVCRVARQFAAIAADLYPGVIARHTLDTIQRRIDENIDLLG